MEQVKVNVTSKIPAGTYSAVTGGCISEFKVRDKEYKAKFTNGVKGFGYSDVITVDSNGELYSSVLGMWAVGLKLKEVIWKEL